MSSISSLPSGSSSTSYSSATRISSLTSRSSSSRKTSGSFASRPDAILRKQVNWESLYFYQKSVVLYHMTVVFCRRFLPKCGDRTVDQMIQAARSGKQNIVEGFADGVTSMELSIKLLNVARASLQELREDYADYLVSHGLLCWDKTHPRFSGLLAYCRTHNKLSEYERFFIKWSADELANCAITLCHMVDRMMDAHLRAMVDDFRENGGIRERMTAIRMGRRQSQQDEITALRNENERLKAEIAKLKRLVAKRL